jgi:anthranilate synthase component 1
MPPARVVTDRAAFEAAVAAAPPGARVPVEVRTTVDDPFDAYRRARTGGWDAMLETGGGRDGRGVFGVDPVERLTVGSDAAVWRDGPDHGEAGGGRRDASDPVGRRSRADRSPTLAALAARLDATHLARGDCDVAYPCGAIGWLSYDVARELEEVPDDTTDDRGLPRLECAFFDRFATWECPAEPPVELRITACPVVGATPPAAAEPGRTPTDGGAGAYERGRERALELARDVHKGDAAVPEPTGTDDQARPGDRAAFESDCGRVAYADRVRRIQRAIRDGETFQTNVAHRLRAPATVHPVEAYAALRDVNPAPYAGLLEFGTDVVSASPELLLERDGDRLLTEPIAGTRPRGADPNGDADLARELRTDEKERAEHAMLVDLERNDLGRVCAPDTVAVDDYRRVDRHPEVMHLVSRVSGRLRDDATLADAIAAVFPGGTVTGAPKPRTLELIDAVEATRRGPYTGSVGLFGFDGRATLNIAIRTLVRADDTYDLHVGAGIVHDSDPDREYAETLDKARGLVAAMDAAVADADDSTDHRVVADD